MGSKVDLQNSNFFYLKSLLMLVIASPKLLLPTVNVTNLTPIILPIKSF